MLALLPQPTAAAGRAQPSASSWSKPVLLFETSDTIQDPAITVDQEGGIHVFWRLSIKQGDASASGLQRIEYTQRIGGRWSKPTDIISRPSPTAPTAAVDRFGTIHLFWHGTDAAEYSATAPVDSAASAAAWTTPAFVTYDNTSAYVTSDVDGRLYLVYPGQGSSGVFYQTSVDGGVTWSFPITVAPTMASNASTDVPRLAVGPDGTIHVVWTEFERPDGWPPLGVYYSRSTDDGQTWSTPIQIAGPGFDQANVVAGPNGLVHVAWNGMSGVHWRYDRWSLDGGKTWSKYVVLKTPGVGGTEGPPQLAVDSSGTVHLVTTDGNRVWYTAWRDGQWSKPEYVPSGNEAGIPPVSVAEAVDTKTRHIEQVVMAMSHGDQLNVVFWDEREQQNRTYLWYTTKKVSAPAIPSRSFSTIATPAASLSTAPSTTELSLTANSGILDSKASTAPESMPLDSRWAIVPGFLAAILIAGGVAGAQIKRGRDR